MTKDKNPNSLMGRNMKDELHKLLNFQLQEFANILLNYADKMPYHQLKMMVERLIFKGEPTGTPYELSEVAHAYLIGQEMQNLFHQRVLSDETEDIFLSFYALKESR